MSVLHYPNAINAPDLQIWNNSTFDHGESDESVAIKDSSDSLQPLFVNRSESFDIDSSKENQAPVFTKSPASVKSPKSQGKPLKLLFKEGLLLPSSQSVSKTTIEGNPYERNINTEIQEIEIEISRLSSKLESLRLEKAEQNLKTSEKRRRIVPAKFMEQKQSQKISATPKKSEEPSSIKFRRRGVSMGPSEIMFGVRSRQMGKPEITPIQSIQNRRKSCFWKLQEIEEEKVTKERGGRSLSLSPKTRKQVSKIQATKKAFTTGGGSKKPIKRDDGVLSCIQPTKLFKEGEFSAPPKNPSKICRIVTSRYSQTPLKSAGNPTRADWCSKRQSPENVKDDNKRGASIARKTHNFPSESGQIQVKENRGKKKLEISSEVVVMDHKSLEPISPSPVSKMADLLPRIKNVRWTNDSPRDSGPAKRVAELMGRKSFFGAEEREMDIPVSQALSFDDDKEEEEN